MWNDPSCQLLLLLLQCLPLPLLPLLHPALLPPPLQLQGGRSPLLPLLLLQKLASLQRAEACLGGVVCYQNCWQSGACAAAVAAHESCLVPAPNPGAMMPAGRVLQAGNKCRTQCFSEHTCLTPGCMVSNVYTQTHTQPLGICNVQLLHHIELM